MIDELRKKGEKAEKYFTTEKKNMEKRIKQQSADLNQALE